ncbi:hypothetical protein [Micromonospora sp. KC721]|uniref:hypothetical protein n=1 Tax=Micromonospora sp. KC721 TaxID=2530380 RepID=UPI001A9EAB56|nr:hypothetical protein [Micromonospora sp. KC721]
MRARERVPAGALPRAAVVREGALRAVAFLTGVGLPAVRAVVDDMPVAFFAGAFFAGAFLAVVFDATAFFAAVLVFFAAAEVVLFAAVLVFFAAVPVFFAAAEVVFFAAMLVFFAAAEVVFFAAVPVFFAAAVVFFAPAVVFFAPAVVLVVAFWAGAFFAAVRPAGAFLAAALVVGAVLAVVLFAAGAFVAAAVVFDAVVFLAGAAFTAVVLFAAVAVVAGARPLPAPEAFGDALPAGALRAVVVAGTDRRAGVLRVVPAVRSVAADLLAAGRVACCASAISVPSLGHALTCLPRRHGVPRRGPSRAVYLPSPAQRASSASHASLRSRTRCRAFSASAAEAYGPRTCRAAHRSTSVSTRW